MKERIKIRDRLHLVSEIAREIGTHGNTVSLNHFDTSCVEDMSYIFSIAAATGGSSGAISNFNGSIDQWDVTSVRNMSGMFKAASSFNQPLNAWDISKVLSMDDMFNNATEFNQPLDLWNVSSVMWMEGKF